MVLKKILFLFIVLAIPSARSAVLRPQCLAASNLQNPLLAAKQTLSVPGEIQQLIHWSVNPPDTLNQWTTEQLASIGYQLIVLVTQTRDGSYDRYRALEDYIEENEWDNARAKEKFSRYNKRTILYPESVIDAFFPHWGNYSYPQKVQALHDLDADHILKSLAKRVHSDSMATRNGFNDIQDDGILVRDLYQVLSRIGEELADRPAVERNLLIPIFTKFPESVWKSGVVPRASEGSNFMFSFSDPRTSSAHHLSLYMDALVGLYGPAVHVAMEDKNGGSETYDNLPYESIVTPWGNLKAIYDQLVLKPGEIVLDLGTAYGRPGHALNVLYPLNPFLGFDIVPGRIVVAQAIAADLPESLSHFAVKNFATESIPEADVYFLYEPANSEDTRMLLQHLELLARNRNKPFRIVATGATGILIPELEKQNWLVGQPHVQLSGYYLAHVYESRNQPQVATPAESRLAATFTYDNLQSSDLSSVLYALKTNMQKLDDSFFTPQVEDLLVTRAMAEDLPFDAKANLYKIIRHFGVHSSESLMRYYRYLSLHTTYKIHPADIRLVGERGDVKWTDALYLAIFADYQKERIYFRDLGEIPHTESPKVQMALKELLQNPKTMTAAKKHFRDGATYFYLCKIAGGCDAGEDLVLLNHHLTTAEDAQDFNLYVLSVIPEIANPAAVQLVQKELDRSKEILKAQIQQRPRTAAQVLSFCQQWPSIACGGLDQLAFAAMMKEDHRGTINARELSSVKWSPDSPFRVRFKEYYFSLPAQERVYLSDVLLRWGMSGEIQQTVEEIGKSIKIQLRQRKHEEIIEVIHEMRAEQMEYRRGGKNPYKGVLNAIFMAEEYRPQLKSLFAEDYDYVCYQLSLACSDRQIE